MEIQERRYITRSLQDQENRHVDKKINVGIPSKRKGISVRGALGDLNSNVQLQRDVNIGKVAVTAAEFEKKTFMRGTVRSNYNHVQSKVDTGLVFKPVVQPSSRPPLRREESTGGLAVRAAARAVIKDAQNKPKEIKKSINVLLQAKKTQNARKNPKLPILKESTKEKKIFKNILKDPTESLSKLKLSDNVINEKQEKNGYNYFSSPKLPADIEDIDAGDDNCPLLLAIYIKDIYRYLTELEEKYPIKPDHLRNQSFVTGKMRATLLDWLVEVQKQFVLQLETYQLAIGIIDRYLQIVPNIEKNQLQLVGATAMYVACKFEEVYTPDVADYVYVTDNAYTKSDIFQCEKDIMYKLGFCLARPIPITFLRRFVKAAHGTFKSHQLAKYFVELSLIEYPMAHYRPSELSAAAVCLSMHLISNQELSEVWTPTLAYYSGYSLEHIEPIIKKIAEIVVDVDNSKNRAIFNKYSDEVFTKVACLPQLKGEAIYALAKLSSS